MLDPDCSGPGLDACDRLRDEGSCFDSEDTVDASQNWLCAAPVTCSSAPGVLASLLHPTQPVCYAVFSAVGTWSESEAACVTAGGHLASVASAAEDAFVSQLVQGNSSLIGATDTASEGSFLWTDGTAFSYTQWNDGEPNNSNDEEHCTEMYSNGAWNDLSCASGGTFICELPSALPPP